MMGRAVDDQWDDPGSEEAFLARKSPMDPAVS